MSTQPGTPTKNQSELLFERYLDARGLALRDYEPQIEGKSKRPDYRIVFENHPILLDVKEFRQVGNIPEGGAYDPYPRIREKINEARNKFKEVQRGLLRASPPQCRCLSYSH